MQIELRTSKTRWVNIDKEVKFKIDYLTMEQDDELKLILYECGFIDSGFEFTDLDPSTNAHLMDLFTKYYRLFIRYTVKDWKGIKDNKGKPVKCELEQGILKKELWEGLVRNLTIEELATIHKKINDEIKLTDIDKKK